MQSNSFAFLAAGAIAALIAAGCAKGSDQSAASSTGRATATAKLSGSAQGDAARGKTIFATYCAQCHAADVNVGPVLKNEKSRKTYAQTVAWIKDPQTPMPKLYPDTIGEKDVADVAAYVQSL
ncbi:MAG: cytochrome c [Candidatus Eremiobacteraeota bacterium]|nr:cytochrome c [Candidatus Eremiobacteraeota bacterium]